MGKLRLTTAQALVKFLDNQYLEVDGVELKFVKGIFAIFGHGNVLGLGQALEQDSGDMRVYQGRNEQGMAHAATGFARQALRRQIIACTSSIGPGAANMITAAGADRVLTMDLHASQIQGFCCCRAMSSPPASRTRCSSRLNRATISASAPMTLSAQSANTGTVLPARNS